MNFIEGTLTESGVETAYFTLDVERDLPDTEPGQDVTVGVRPEDVTIAADATFETDSGPVGAADASDMDGTPSQSIPVETDVLEPVGDDIYVYTVLVDERSAQTTSGQPHATADGGTTTDQSGMENAGSNDGGTGVTESEERLLMSIPPMPDMDTYEAAGQRTEIVLNREMVHLFDAETGEAITHDLTTADDSGADGTSVDGSGMDETRSR
jgi:multiple sugar transport system ATP-binding protein